MNWKKDNFKREIACNRKNCELLRMHEHSRKWFWLTKCWRINEIRMHWSHRVDVLGDGLVVLVREDGKNGGSEVKHVEEDMTLILLSTSSLFLLLYTTKLISCCTSKFFSALAHVKWQLCTFIQFFLLIPVNSFSEF